MSKTYSIHPPAAQRAHITAEKYQTLYQQSREDPDAFWQDQARRLDWLTFPIGNILYQLLIGIF